MGIYNNKVIQGEKVILRPITMEDTDYIVKWRNNPSVQKNFIFREKFTNEMHKHWMETKVKNGEVVQYIIISSDDKTPIGSVYYRDIDSLNKSAEFGIFIGEDSARGKGIGTETTRLFTRYGLKDMGLHRISLRVLDGNDGAYRAYEKSGFKKEGVFRDMVYLDGEYRNVIFMSMLSSDVSDVEEV